MIVDDEPDLTDMLAFTLQKRGYETVQAHSGLEAWRKLAAKKFDLLVLDIMMPDLDGWELCRRIRQNESKEIRETGILMLTARASSEDRVKGLELGADDYLIKPFSLSELALRVENLLGKRQFVTE